MFFFAILFYFCVYHMLGIEPRDLTHSKQTLYHWATLPASNKCLYSELYQMMVLTSELALSCVTVHQPLCDQQRKILGDYYSHRTLVHEV